ncbi:MAG: single-stranded-DNA-specific exonuclease RecJ [Parvibaculales bacterium]
MSKEQSVLGVECSLNNYHWKWRNQDEALATGIAQRFSLPEAIARILVGRGVKLEEVEQFLKPTIRKLMPNPLSFKDMEQAVTQLALAIQRKKKIAVFGDYDVDGATSSALLKRFFSHIGVEVSIYIPDRVKEGYGPNPNAVEKLHKQGIEFLITVDCGMQAYDALKHAMSLDMEVIVIDHHQSGDTLPEASSIINPKRIDDESGMDNLAAVGVVFLFVVALSRKLGISEKDNKYLMQWLDLVALGTVCDVVPLKGLNRAFVRTGLEIMAKRQNKGLVALMDNAQLTARPTPYDLGFRLGPRVNAGGRVGECNLGARLLASTSGEEAVALAMRLDEYNSKRQEIEKELVGGAILEIEKNLQATKLPKIICIAQKQWHVGVIGIVAARVKDKFRRPAIVIAFDKQGQGKGSARSVDGLDMGALIGKALSLGLIENGGGHKMAAGISLKESQLEGFQKFLEKEMQKLHIPETQELQIDAALSPEGANRDFLDSLEAIGPFGAGNPTPKFLFANIIVEYADIVGENHVRCSISSTAKQGRLKAICFGSANTPLGKTLLENRMPMHVIGKLQADDFHGKRGVQLVIKDGF